ncbi:GNAT family N-acetyltransferase [Paracoccus aerodenitrificans]|uniref:GNAT family N-acetyltransferase n=1 Tax=Paracoccus aerodenitrificans TaxID=3017781 RepID=UPI0022F104DE|nr:GNAT family N-acetyltransferase [Paracoccus aerodenitrificans]WBU63002.1 GNAT family N-acetyltransferase [Paracoccus aerodenitrificans]
MSLTVTVHQAIAEIPAAEWDATGAGRNPFTTHRFLAALEDSASVGGQTGWVPAHLAARDEDSLLGVAPCYIKLHSQGEYIFDHAWADALERAGGQYYPKLQCAVPFTPVTGPRLIANDPAVQTGLLNAMAQFCTQNGLSGAHVTFCTEAEARLGQNAGFLPRTTQQFHWVNEDYADYEDFLSRLSSRKRKNLRKERSRAQEFGGRILRLQGDEIQPGHWDAFWAFYQDTGARKWGRPYLTRNFFDRLHETMRDDALLVLAERDGVPVAGALNLVGPDAIYGRYWGAVEEHAFLHFEMCYHQAIDYAIEHGLSRVEAGAQGEHKLARGYLPTETYSLHWVADPGFRRALEDYLLREREAVGEEIEFLRDWGPFRRG